MAEVRTFEHIRSRAMKLKALADRGDFGEANNAKDMLDEFMKENNLTMFDIDDESFLREWSVKNIEHEVLLTHVILSVNPFSVMEKKRRKIKVRLDEHDFAEIENKLDYFYTLFKAEEKRFLYWITKNSIYDNKMYDNEKSLLLTAFLNFHGDFFIPDEETRNKFRAKKAEMNEDIKRVIVPEKELSFEEKQRRAEEDLKNGKFKDIPTFSALDNRKMEFFRSRLNKPNYVKARKTLPQGIKTEEKNKLKRY